MYYVEVFRGNFFPTRVFVSQYIETRAEAEKYAREIENDAEWNDDGKVNAYVVEV